MSRKISAAQAACIITKSARQSPAGKSALSKQTALQHLMAQCSQSVTPTATRHLKWQKSSPNDHQTRRQTCRQRAQACCRSRKTSRHPLHGFGVAMAQRAGKEGWREFNRQMGGHERQAMKTLYAISGASCAIIPAAAAIACGGNAYLIAGFALTLLGGGGVGWLLCDCATRADVATLPESPTSAANLHRSGRKRSPRVRSISTLRPLRDGLPA